MHADALIVPLNSAVLPTTGGFGQRVLEGAVRTLNKGDHLFFDGDEATHVYRVEAGHVCIYRLLADGRRQVVDFAFPGDYVGLGALGQYDTNAQAKEYTRLRCLPFSELRTIVRENPRLGLELYEKIAGELADAREQLFSVSQRSAIERVAGFLMLLSRRNAARGEDPYSIVLPMSRSDIADYLGLTIETVSRTISKLRRDRLIDLEQCVLITLRDIDGLSNLAEAGCA